MWKGRKQAEIEVNAGQFLEELRVGSWVYCWETDQQRFLWSHRQSHQEEVASDRAWGKQRLQIAARRNRRETRLSKQDYQAVLKTQLRPWIKKKKNRNGKSILSQNCTNNPTSGKGHRTNCGLFRGSRFRCLRCVLRWTKWFHTKSQEYLRRLTGDIKISVSSFRAETFKSTVRMKASPSLKTNK